MKLTAKQKRLLKGSIRKWVRIVNHKGMDRGADNCPLCREYWENHCVGCPVREVTGQRDCTGSPYDELEPYETSHVDPEVYDALARSELAFLRAILKYGA